MCEFISWIRKGQKTYFLTGDQVFRSRRGDALREYTQSPDDYCGHGAIRWFYEIEGGENHECADLSTPDNFPPEIANAIKSGAMRGLEMPFTLLTDAALAEYLRITGPAWAEYLRIRGAAWAEYQRIAGAALAEYERIRGAALAEYQRIRGPALAEYERIRGAALAEYERIRGPALAEYERIAGPAFWDLFALPENRVEAWR